jgi:hypothetical protein
MSRVLPSGILEQINLPWNDLILTCVPPEPGNLVEYLEFWKMRPSSNRNRKQNAHPSLHHRIRRWVEFGPWVRLGRLLLRGGRWRMHPTFVDGSRWNKFEVSVRRVQRIGHSHTGDATHRPHRHVVCAPDHQLCNRVHVRRSWAHHSHCRAAAWQAGEDYISAGGCHGTPPLRVNCCH